MKKLSSFFILIIINIFSISIYANDRELANINLTLSGEVTLPTCGILENESDKYIDLGVNSTKDLNIIGKTTKLIPIKFNLINCLANSPITIKFNGAEDVNDHGLLALNNINNSAQNIAIEVLNPDQTRLRINSKSINLVIDQEGRLSTNFYARYVVTKTPVIPGIAQSSAEFTIQYD